MSEVKGKWSKERAWEWYNAQPWIRGFNGYPSNCVNRVAMWQRYNHKEVFDQIAYEFDIARQTGFNAVRAIIQFEVWYCEHDSFMSNLEEYLTLADSYGIKVMLTLGNDCTVPKDRFREVVFGEQNVDWGYHSGIKAGPHAAGYNEPGYCLLDEPDIEPFYYKMVDEIAAKYAHDERIQIWDVWNEPGNGRRYDLSRKAMEKFFEIIRSHDPIQPLTADCWSYEDDFSKPRRDIETVALELSDVITFHYYGSYENMIRIIENLREKYDRPLINNEWLNRIAGNDVAELFPLFYLEKIGSYHWGLMQGYSQTYEPWGHYFIEYLKEGSTLDLRLWQHDIFRFNGLPYDVKEIKTIEKFCALADERDRKNGVLK